MAAVWYMLDIIKDTEPLCLTTRLKTTKKGGERKKCSSSQALQKEAVSFPHAMCSLRAPKLTKQLTIPEILNIAGFSNPHPTVSPLPPPLW